jgi:hypothetical protein
MMGLKFHELTHIEHAAAGRSVIFIIISITTH